MAKKVKSQMFKSAYFVANLIALFFFLLLIWYVRRGTEREMEKYVDATTKNVALSNINILGGIIEDYETELLRLQAAWGTKQKSLAAFSEAVSFLKKADVSISSIEMKKRGSISQNAYFSCDKKSPNKETHLCFELPLAQTDSVITMNVSLQSLHGKIAASKNLSQAYTTVTLGGRYVFHPDEKLLGKKEDFQSKITRVQALKENKNLLTGVYSNYLEMNVHRYYEKRVFNDKEWVFTANVPNLGVKEYMSKTLDSFLVILLCGISILLFVIAWGVVRWRAEFMRRKDVEGENLMLQLKNEQQKKTVIATKLEILKSGLNPHFLFNSLGSLKILIDKKPELAKSFSARLSSVYRYLLKHESQSKVKLEEELAFTEDYIQLQKIRFANKIYVTTDLSKELRQKQIPPISIQLLVENCIKHTVISEAEPLNINIYHEGGHIVVTNNYNPRLSEVEQSGKGIENLKKRYSLLTRRECSFAIVGKQYIAKIPLLS